MSFIVIKNYKLGVFYEKILVISILVLSIILITSCASSQVINPEYTTNVNLNASDLVLGNRIEVSGRFSNEEVASGYAKAVLSAKALEGSNYDFIFMPRLEKKGSTITLYGRPARYK